MTESRVVNHLSSAEDALSRTWWHPPRSPDFQRTISASLQPPASFSRGGCGPWAITAADWRERALGVLRASIWNSSLGSPFWPRQDSWWKKQARASLHVCLKGSLSSLYSRIFTSISGVGYRQCSLIYFGQDFCYTMSLRSSFFFFWFSPFLKYPFHLFFPDECICI